MSEDGLKLKKYIETNINIEQNSMPNYYRCLPVCIIDDIFSLQSKYETITFPTVQRFANYFLNGNLYTSNYSVDEFINDLDREGLANVMMNILNNRQCIGNRRKIDVCYDVAKTLQKLKIQSFNDFEGFTDKDYLTYSLRQVKGVGDAAIDYLFMMVGDDNRVKPDIHIHHCIRDAIGHDVSNEDCQSLFREVASSMNINKPYVTPRFLDGCVWKHYAKAKF